MKSKNSFCLYLLLFRLLNSKNHYIIKVVILLFQCKKHYYTYRFLRRNKKSFQNLLNMEFEAFEIRCESFFNWNDSMTKP